MLCIQVGSFFSWGKRRVLHASGTAEIFLLPARLSLITLHITACQRGGGEAAARTRCTFPHRPRPLMSSCAPHRPRRKIRRPTA